MPAGKRKVGFGKFAQAVNPDAQPLKYIYVSRYVSNSNITISNTKAEKPIQLGGEIRKDQKRIDRG